MCECTCVVLVLDWRSACMTQVVPKAGQGRLPMTSLVQSGRFRVALVTVLAALALPAAAHASLLQGRPTNVQGAFWDDESIGGDDHMGWGHAGSEVQPMAVTVG